jgi:dihydrodipicolinate synthase/N-acetylneuraminate lyase
MPADIQSWAISDLMRALSEEVCKTAMELVGKPMSRVREPMENLTDAEKKELRGIFEKMSAPVAG